RPMAPAEAGDLRFALSYFPKGLEQGRGDVRIVENGTFVNSQQVMPSIGYADANELVEDDARKKHGLAEKPRMRDLDDPKGIETNYVAGDGDWISFEATVGTSADQIALAPGYLQKDWVEGGRRQFHYAMDAKILNFYSFLSARYAVERDRWNDVAIEVYHHPGHAYDTDRMIRGVNASLKLFTKGLVPDQHHQARRVEFPRSEP